VGATECVQRVDLIAHEFKDRRLTLTAFVRMSVYALIGHLLDADGEAGAKPLKMLALGVKPAFRFHINELFQLFNF